MIVLDRISCDCVNMIKDLWQWIVILCSVENEKRGNKSRERYSEIVHLYILDFS